MKRVFLAFLAFLFSVKNKQYPRIRQSPYRELVIIDDPVQPPPPPPFSTKYTWHVSLSKLHKSFMSWVESGVNYVYFYIKRMRSLMSKIISLVIFFASILGCGALYDISNPSTLGLRTAGALSCIIMAVLSIMFFIDECNRATTK